MEQMALHMRWLIRSVMQEAIPDAQVSPSIAKHRIIQNS